jgi:hypothetical protein
MMKKVYTIEEIRNIIVPRLKQLDATRIALFGSYARGEARADSDVDILVSLPDIVDILKYLETKDALRQVLGKDVDILDYRDISRFIKDEVLADSIIIYDKSQERY